jgi:3-hydroxyisobutyrate dehydrogenase-like beta-hydroxyacid dehydrogenase
MARTTVRRASGGKSMKIESIGVMSPGDMGQAVALQLKQKGFNVCTALDQRSARSKTLAREAGLTDVGSIAKLIDTCEVILSIMNPGAALAFAGEFAQALSASRRKPLFVDCNAIAPGTLQAINAKITSAGGRCADGGIVGPPPRGNWRPPRSRCACSAIAWGMRARSRCVTAR